jgi:hypothetical protein
MGCVKSFQLLDSYNLKVFVSDKAAATEKPERTYGQAVREDSEGARTQYDTKRFDYGGVAQLVRAKVS